MHLKVVGLISNQHTSHIVDSIIGQGMCARQPIDVLSHMMVLSLSLLCKINENISLGEDFFKG